MTTGVVLSVDVERYGDTLTVATAATDLVLQVDNIDDFADEDDFAAGPQWLVIGDSAPMQYVSVDDDADTVQLAAAVGGVYEVGDPVRMWDPAAGTDGGEVVGYVCWVELDEAYDEDQPVPAEVQHDRMVYFGIDNLAGLIGARVTLEQDLDEPEAWHVAQVVGRAPVVDAESIDFPTFLAHRIADTAALASGTWHRMAWGTVDISHGFGALDAGEWLVATRPGRYDNVSVQNWQNNTSGARRARLAKRAVDGSVTIVSPEFRTAPDSTAGDASPTLVHTLWLEPGEAVSVEVWQSTGSGLSVTGDAGGLRTTWAVNYRGSR